MPKSDNLPMGWMNLPPDCEVRGGKVVRLYNRMTMGGSYQLDIRPVAMTIDESREKRMDYYDPERGWLLEGWKWQSDSAEWGGFNEDFREPPTYTNVEGAKALVAGGD